LLWLIPSQNPGTNAGSEYSSFFAYRTSNFGRYSHEQWCSYQSEKFKQRKLPQHDGASALEEDVDANSKEARLYRQGLSYRTMSTGATVWHNSDIR